MDLSEFDITNVDDTKGVFMALENPKTGAILTDGGDPPRQYGIWLLGSDSEKAKKYVRMAQNRRIKMAQGRRSQILTAEENEADELGLLVACTTDGYVKVDGEVLECTPEAVKKFYVRFPHWRDQADVFMGDRSNFLKK